MLTTTLLSPLLLALAAGIVAPATQRAQASVLVSNMRDALQLGCAATRPTAL